MNDQNADRMADSVMNESAVSLRSKRLRNAVSLEHRRVAVEEVKGSGGRSKYCAPCIRREYFLKSLDFCYTIKHQSTNFIHRFCTGLLLEVMYSSFKCKIYCLILLIFSF